MRQVWKLPQTESSTQERPKRCPRCGGRRVYRHSRLRRRVIDPKLETVEVIRYRCEDCRKLMRVHPAGIVPQQQQSRRLQVLSSLLYALGLSYDRASLVLDVLGCGVVKSTIWQNVPACAWPHADRQQLGKAAVRRWQPGGRRPVLGVDETQLKVKGKGITLGFVTDPESGQIVALEVLASREATEMERWLNDLLERFGCEVVVSDDLESYKPAVDAMGREHQLCLAHARKALRRRLKKIPGYEGEKQQIHHALQELTPQAKRDLQRLRRRFASARPPTKGQRQSPQFAMRMCIHHLLENWRRLTCYQRGHKGRDALGRLIPRNYPVPTTNNATENSIGRAIKVRSKLTRGFKSLPGAIHTSLLVACIGGVLAGLSFEQLIR